jgi:hypothetical protein
LTPRRGRSPSAVPATVNQKKTILTGDLVFSEVRPKVSIGASLWSRSAGATQRIGGASFSKDSVGLDVDDPEKAYQGLVNNLIYAVTPEFRPTWEWRRVASR